MRNLAVFVWFVFLSLCASNSLAAQDLIQKLREAEARYGLPDMSLVALSKTESSLHWFALNFDDGASFYPKTKRQALAIIRNVSKHPFIIRLQRPDESSEVYFFPSKQAAQKAVSKARRSDEFKVQPHPDGSVVRKLDLLNTGLCAMQLNFRWQAHGQGRTAETLLDPDFCIEHAAKFVAGLVRKHGFEKGVGCYYTCGNKPSARANRKEYFERYSRHYDRLSQSSQLAQR